MGGVVGVALEVAQEEVHNIVVQLNVVINCGALV